jgi:hypothetical protein
LETSPDKATKKVILFQKINPEDFKPVDLMDAVKLPGRAGIQIRAN